MIILPDILKPHHRIFIRLDKTPERDEQTDGQADRYHNHHNHNHHHHHHGISSASITLKT